MMYSNKSLRTTDNVVTNKFKSAGVVDDVAQDKSITMIDVVKCVCIAIAMGIAMVFALGLIELTNVIYELIK